MSAFAGDAPLDTLLKGVETRYNHAKTLQVLFKEDYTAPGRPRRSDSGTAHAAQAGRMRWDYSQPKGKLFVSDGKFLWLYTPDENRVEKMKLKESEDMRAPLAFLLGKLDFDKEFQEYPGEAGGFRYADHGRAEDRQPALLGRGIRGDAGQRSSAK